MDPRQLWNGGFIPNEVLSDYFLNIESSDVNKTINQELLVTFALASLLQSRNNVEHFVGIPNLSNSKNITFGELINDNSMQNENFDKVIISKDKPLIPIMIQIKRYMNSPESSTLQLFEYICKKTKRYGKSPELNMVFDIQAKIKIDSNLLYSLLTKESFEVASIYVFSRNVSPNICCIFEIFPKFTDKVWYLKK